ncbi:pyridoxamine 5'-phosphate oxidase family protein [Jannaschia sp. KMU-145]|uniref:pyridoxamine 5'-phosphate oxidase family protein n=1 Tax=Jannaschia halovivens TaxID=3388667 RepID=UPI00396AF1C3
MPETHHPPDPEIRALAARLVGTSHGALATSLDGAPLVTRVGCLWLAGEGMGLLVSDLSDHARALSQDPKAAILLGEPDEKGDPLTHPRLTVRGTVDARDKAAWRETWLAARPKARLYYDFTDFRLMVLEPSDALLNGGFGRASRLAPSDLP